MISFQASHWSTLPSPQNPPPPTQRVDLPCVLFRIVPAWSLKNKDLFLIGLVDGPCAELYKQRSALDWACRMSPRGALKTRRSSGLESWIVPLWSLRNKEVFQIGLVDHPALCSGLVSLSKWGGVPNWT